MIMLVGLGIIFLFVFFAAKRKEEEEDLNSIPTNKRRRVMAGASTVFVALLLVLAYRQYLSPITADIETRIDTGKYILWTGWGAPSLEYLENNLDVVRSFPYDGMIVGSSTFQTDPKNVDTSITRATFSTVSPLPDYTDLANRWRNLTTETGALQHSLGYIYFKIEREQPFTDTVAWDEQILPRWRKTLEHLHAAGIKGVFLDTENYSSTFSIWDITPTYEGLNELGKNNISLPTAMQDPTFAAKAQPFIDRANHYGREMVKIMKEVYGDDPVDLMVSHAGSGLSIFSKLTNTSWYNDGTVSAAYPDKHHELTPSFMDGIVSEADGSAVSFIDGMEYTYVYADTVSGTSMQKHRYGYNYAHSIHNIQAFSSVPDTYAENLKASPSIWLDYGQSYPWYYQQQDGQWWDFQKDASGKWFQGVTPGHTDTENYYSPQKFTSALRAALTLSDKYVWVYTERPDVFGIYAGLAPKNGFTLDVPLAAAYSQAVRNARQPGVVKAPTCSASLTTPPKIMEGHPTVLSPQVTAVDPNGFAIPNNTNVIVDGDSISSGHKLSSGQDWPSVLMSLPSFSGKGLKYNFAQSNSRVSWLSDRYAENVYPLRPAGDTKVIVMVWAGTNDLLDGRSAPSVYTDLQTYWQTAKNDGFEVWAFTTIARGNFSAAQNTEVAALNQLIREGGGWDRLIDIATVFTDASDTSLYLDGIHPSAQGSKRIAWFIDDLSGGHTLVALPAILPAGVTIGANGIIEWTPSASQVGSQSFAWRFGNGFAAVDCQTEVEVEPSQPIVSLDVVGDGDELVDGQAVTYTLQVANNGNDVAQDARIEVTMPDGWVFISADAPTVINGSVVEIVLDTLDLSVTKEIELQLMPIR